MDAGHEPPLLDEADESIQVPPHPAVRAQHLELKRPDEAEILLRIEAGGGPTGQDLAPAMEDSEGGDPGIAPGEVDDHVPPARELPPMRLAVRLVDPFHEVLLRV